jgi:hypothetical protein
MPSCLLAVTGDRSKLRRFLQVPHGVTHKKMEFFVDLFPSSGEGSKAHILWGPLEGTNLSHWTLTEIDTVSETLCVLVI